MAGMTTRVLVTLQPDAAVADVVGRLTALGDAEVRPPQPELPDVCVASVDEHRTTPQQWATRAARVPGVANAEVDQLRWTM